MKETPIIMSGNHPKLILDGTKTQTRRVIPKDVVTKNTCASIIRGGELGFTNCPYGQVGDRLIIKEAWAADKLWDDKKPSEIYRLSAIWYPADGLPKPMWVGRTRSARFMCNWMSRARAEIIEVRVERVQEISEEDAKAEGVDKCEGFRIYPQPKEFETVNDYRMGFTLLWDSLNAKRGYGWEVNPFVWVLSFRRLNGQG